MDTNEATCDRNLSLTAVCLAETPEAFPNPMKGFRPSRYMREQGFSAGEYVTTVKHYIRYTDLEASMADDAQTMIDWSNTAWAGIEKQNLKVIPRVVLAYPADRDSEDALFWPAGLRTDEPVGKWLGIAFVDRLTAFISKLGQAWNSDPRVAAIEMGLWGRWGEHHIWPMQLPDGAERIPPDIAQRLGDAFAAAFPDKEVMVRYPQTFTQFDFGFYWDSFALPEEHYIGHAMVERNNWQTAMMTGEVAYDWGDQSVLGGSPEGTLASDGNTAYVIDWVRRTHTSSLGWIAEYKQSEAVTLNAAKLQKAMGYRFVIREAAYTGMAQAGETLQLAFSVDNVGSAPFYYPWQVTAYLLDSGRNPVWSAPVHADIRRWMPGESFAVRAGFTLPRELANGQYVLALAIADPAGGKPALRFANTNYYSGGYTPLGNIGIGQAPRFMDMGPFDGLYDDRSLAYALSR